MEASNQYKKRLAELLSLDNLEHLPDPEGPRTKKDSARFLEICCGGIVSRTVIAKWKSQDFACQLDNTGLSAVSKIVYCESKTPTEIDVYLRTGSWLSGKIVKELSSLLAAKKVIDREISKLIAA